MNNTVRRSGALAALAFLLIACADAPTGTIPVTRANARNAATVERMVQQNFQDLTGAIVEYDCEGVFGEQIQLEGGVFETWTLTSDPADGLHATIHTMPVGLRAVGLTSGAEYLVTERQTGAFTGTAMVSTGSYQHTFSLNATSLGVRLTVVSGGVFTINANGELAIERPLSRASCAM